MNLIRPFVRHGIPVAKALLIACLIGGLQWEATAQSYDVTLYVDPSGNDQNSGSSANPLKTIQKAADKAVANKNNDLSTRVLIRPGTYREFVDVTTWTNWPTNDPTNAELMTFEGTDPNNRPVISGADVYTNWTQQGNLYTHSWNYNWGLWDAPWSDTIIDLEDIVLRREMVYINDERLDPVLSQGELVPGTFFVNESTNLLYVYPPTAVNFPSATVEVAVREGAFDAQFEFNLMLKNLRFEKSVDPWDNAVALVRIVACDNLTIENVEFRHANWTGTYIGELKNATLKNISANDNGGRGFATWRITGMLMENSESLRNNWRGYLGGFTGWTVGNNVESSRHVQLINHNASNNFSRGLWFDTDVYDAVIDNATINDNLNDGFFLEAVQGPITLKNSELRRNLRNGLFSGMAENVTLDRNVFEGNGQSAIVISGNNDGRGINIWDQPRPNYYTVLTRNWTLTANEFIGTGDYLIGTTVSNTRWSEFIGSLSSNHNYWCDNTKQNVFRRYGGVLLNFTGWKSHTGEDQTSSFCSPVLPVELELFEAIVDDSDVVLKWQTLSETNNVGFEVEREVDNEFETLGFVQGSGTISTAVEYSFRVENLQAGTHRFRLKQLDVDGSFEYSPVIESTIGLTESYLLTDIYPNPFSANGQFQLTVRDEQNVSIDLYNLLGKQVRTVFSGPLSPGSAKQLIIDGSDLANGLYLLRVNGKNFRHTARLVIAH